MGHTPAERFLAKVNQSGPLPLVRGVTGRCWLWTGGTDGRADGYGTFWLDGRTTKAHRTSYALHVGPIPDAHDIDHQCRNRRCVRPDHLRPLTHRENVLASTNVAALRAAQTHCHRGHPFDKANTYVAPNGTRKCRACRGANTTTTTEEAA
ncbi:HNH endonuclease signature motif containing protein [Streptomyces zhihengii]